VIAGQHAGLDGGADLEGFVVVAAEDTGLDIGLNVHVSLLVEGFIALIQGNGKCRSFLIIVLRFFCMDSGHEVTRLLERWGNGDEAALGELLPFVYGELRRLASQLMRSQAAGHTLQPTALIHEVYLKLAERPGQLSFENRAAFLGLAAKAMRRVLVDHARASGAGKRGGEALRVTLVEGLGGSTEKAADVAALDAALEAMAELEPRRARIVELKYFGGATGEEIAAALGIGTATVTRELRLAEAWLYRELFR
jgi:RNA polymerase sigma factor (TIGR02999 family)